MSNVNTPEGLSARFAEIDRRLRALESVSLNRGPLVLNDSLGHAVFNFDPELEGIGLGGTAGIVGNQSFEVRAVNFATPWKLAGVNPVMPRVYYSGTVIVPNGGQSQFRLYNLANERASSVLTLGPGSHDLRIVWNHGLVGQRDGTIRFQARMSVEVYDVPDDGVPAPGVIVSPPDAFSFVYPEFEGLTSGAWNVT